LKILVEVGVPYVAVLDAFEHLGTRKEQGTLLGQDNTQRMAQLRAVVSLLEQWVSMARTPDGKTLQEVRGTGS